jgi:serine/threonine protein phosphatase PrpC
MSAPPPLNFWMAPPPPLLPSPPIPTISSNYNFLDGDNNETEVTADPYDVKTTVFNEAATGAIMRGGRRNQEDRLFALQNSVNGEKIYCVLDGHSGSSAADCTKSRLLQTIVSNKNTQSFSDAITNAFIETEEIFKTSVRDDSGACVLLASIQGSKVTIANSGDCRAILVKKDGSIKVLNTEHSVLIPDEAARNIAAGFYIDDDSVFTGCNGLRISRSIGDLKFKGPSEDPTKHGVTCVPEILTIESDDTWHTLLLMSDGCDNVPLEMMASMCMKMSNNDLAQHIIKEAKSSCDNATCIAISMNSTIASNGGGGGGGGESSTE